MSVNGKIEKATGDLICWGIDVDFTNDGSFDPATQEVRTDVPDNPKRKGQQGETQFHRWDGSAWVLVGYTIGDPTHKVETWDRRKLLKEEWFNNLDGSGNPIEKVKEMVYNYQGRKLVSTTTREFSVEGEQTGPDVTHEFYKSGFNVIRKRV